MRDLAEKVKFGLIPFLVIAAMPASGPSPEVIEPEFLLTMPDVRQTTVYACGDAALQAVLAYYNIDARQDTLMSKAETTETDGTHYWEIAKVAQTYGLRTIIEKDMTIDQLIASIDDGIPVIVALQAWIDDGDDPRDLAQWANRWEDGHYLVAIGYDSSRIYFEDPAMFGIGYIAFDELDARWHDRDDVTGERLNHLGISFLSPSMTAPTESPRFISID